METLQVALDGYTDLPLGKIANVVTYFETRTPPSDAPQELPALFLRHIPSPAVGWYRSLINMIGEPWLWTAVATTPDDQLAARLNDQRNEVHVLERDGRTIGISELDRRGGGDVEVLYFGVVASEIGTGVARFLMDRTLRQAFAGGAVRVWLHTCTFDHPAAVRFYQRAGLRPYKFAIEVMDDPRLAGHLPETAAPHVALIRPERD